MYNQRQSREGNVACESLGDKHRCENDALMRKQGGKGHRKPQGNKAKLTANASAARKEIQEKTKKPTGAWLELRPKQPTTSTSSSFPMKIGKSTIATNIALPNMSGVNNRSRSNSVNVGVSPTSVTALGCWHHGSQSDLVSMLEEDCKISEADAAKASHSSIISDAFKKHVGFDQIEEDKRMIQDIDHTFCVPTELTALQQANLETSNKTYYTSIELFRIHIMATPMFARIRDEIGNLPLHNAITKADVNPLVVSELIKRYPAGVRTKDARGDLPLSLACQQKKINPSVIKALIQAFPEAASRKIYGSLPIHRLLYNNERMNTSQNLEVLKVLIQTDPKSLLAVNSHGKIPIQYVCENLNWKDAIELMATSCPASLTVPNKEGFSAIDIGNANMFTIDGRIKSLLLKKETLRMMLRMAKHEELSDDHKRLFGNLNYDIRSIAFLLSHKSSDQSAKFAQFCKYLSEGIPGLWREIIMYL